MLVLELLGTLCLRCDTAAVPLAAQQNRRLGLLAILALGDKRGLSRDRLEAYLWPESSAERARHALDQAVYALRQALGGDVIISTGRELRLNPECVVTDLWKFEEAIRGAQWTSAIGVYRGPLLDGFHFGKSGELQMWIDAERTRLRQEYQNALECLATLSAKAGDHSESVTWWRLLANSDPLSAGAAKKLMRALVAAGDRVGAVKHARLYQKLVRQELEVEPDSEIEDLASRFGHPAMTDSVGTREQKGRSIVPSPPDATVPPPGAADTPHGDSRSGEPRARLRTNPKRVGVVLASSILFVLLIGAVAVESRQSLAHRSTPTKTGALRRTAIVLPTARDSYLQGLNAWRDGSREGLESAVGFFRRAIQVDSQYAEAYAGLADAYVMLGYFGYGSKDEMFPKAKEAALRSMRLDSKLPSAHPALAYALTWERDFAGANAEFRKATALDPTSPTGRGVVSDPTYAAAHQWYPILLMILGQKNEVVAASRRAPNNDPFVLNVPVIELTFEKWFTAYPAMEGNTSYGPGTIAGEVLSRIDDGVFTHLIARYEITDPNGARSFKAVIQGKADNKTGNYALNGILAWGWMVGANVHVDFQRIAPCKFGKLKVCFQGTIQVRRE